MPTWGNGGAGYAGRSCSIPEADVIDGVEATTPAARWPLLAQMVCDLTNRGHRESEG